ncbi:hypothetical protein LguiA_005749 [Lonicera macranthoides]
MVEGSMGKEKEGGIDDEGRNSSLNNNNHQNNNQLKDSSSKKGKSCKGCLYYSSTLKSNSRNPLCVGFTRSLPQVPRYIVGESEMEASKEGRSLSDFKYGCVGYSVYPDMKANSSKVQETPTELPVCVGIEVLVDRRSTTADAVPAHAHSREEGNRLPQPRTQKSAHAVGDEFLSRFTRNASLVAIGVAKNMRRVGNHIKETVDDILYPYRRRPK